MKSVKAVKDFNFETQNIKEELLTINNGISKENLIISRIPQQIGKYRVLEFPILFIYNKFKILAEICKFR